MKKFLFVLMGVFAFSGAFAAGENVPTSKSYVDAAVAQKQDKISASIIMPAGYTQLEYISTKHNAYIMTGLTVNDFDMVYTRVNLHNYRTEEGDIFLPSLFGASNANTGAVSAKSYRFYDPIPQTSVSAYNTKWSSQWANPTTNAVFPTNSIASAEIKLASGSQYIKINGELVASDSLTATLNNTNIVPLFAYNYNNTRISYIPDLDCYTAKFYLNGSMVRNFIPARRDSDGVLGMYDTVSNTFFTNAGTGEFIAGPVITPGTQVLTNTGTAGEIGAKGIYDANGAYVTQQNNLVDAVTMNTAVQNAIDSEFQCIEWLDPNDHSSDCLLLQLGGITQVPAGYTQLEYISTKHNAYIMTGLTVNDFDMVYTRVNLHNYRTEEGDQFIPSLFGASNANTGAVSAKSYRFYDPIPQTSVSAYNTKWSSQWANPTTNAVFPTNSIASAEIKLASGSQYIKINGELVASDSLTATLNNTNIVPLFAYNYNNTQIAYIPDLDCYTAKFYLNGSMVRNFIPARRNSDGVLGMYDTVSNTFFTNAGTGKFIAGPIVYLPTGE